MTYFHHFFQTTDGVLAGYCDQWLAKLVSLDRYFVLCLLPFLVHDLTADSSVNHQLNKREGQLRRVEKGRPSDED